MKFKYLIIAFSIIIVLILLLAALLPLFITWSGAGLQSGLEPRSSPMAYAAEFRFAALFFFILMIIVLVSFGVYILVNYRLFSLLEREDWPALAYYLEQEIFVKGRCTARRVQLLASSYMVISDYPSVLKLESKIMLAKPVTVKKNALIFGAARILSGNYREAAVFFRKYAEENVWTRWYYGFSSLLCGVHNQAETEFIASIESSGDTLITGLSAYFLDNTLIKYSQKPQDCRSAAENGRKIAVSKIKNSAGWNKVFKKAASEIHIAIIRKYIDETGKWLFISEVKS